MMNSKRGWRAWFVVMAVGTGACTTTNTNDDAGTTPADAAVTADAGGTNDAGGGRDAAVWPDAAMAPDAAMTRDAAMGSDAAMGPDAAMTPDAAMGGDAGMDAGSTTEDAGSTTEDGGNTSADGGNTPMDGGNTTTDGGNTTDGGGGTGDSGASDDAGGTPDSGNTAVDAGNTCACPPGAACGATGCELPDLTLENARVTVAVRTFNAADCNVVTGCLNASGTRRVVDVNVDVTNAGQFDLVLGVPGSGLWEQDMCLQTVLPALVGYQVLNNAGVEVDTGRFASGCVADPAGPTARYTCALQGLSVGASSVDQPAQSCSLVDTTALPAGSYTLRLTVNPDGVLADSNATNNTVDVPFNVTAVPCVGGTVCGAQCCPGSVTCVQDRCPLPDLTVDTQGLISSLELVTLNFDANSCVMVEGCIAQPGDRRLLRFDTTTPNIGQVDMVLGSPTNNPLFEFSPCHGHHHFTSYANYRLLRTDGSVAATGHKQAFCLMDTTPVSGGAGRGYNCGNQGISAGWADTYGAGLDCQWVDVTGVPAGDYTLEVAINNLQILAEESYANNTVTVPVTITPDPNGCQPTPEICFDGVDQDCVDGPDNGCPPLTGHDTCANPFDITPPELTVQGTLLATSDASLVPSCGAAAGPAMTFAFTVTQRETVYLSTYGSSMDTVLAVYPAGCATADAACSDDGCGVGQSHLLTNLDPGDYVAVVKAKQAGVGGAVQFKLQRGGCAPANILAGPGNYSGTTTAFGTTTTTCGSGAGGDALWAYAACPGSTALSATTCSAAGATPRTNHDTVLEWRAGRCAAPAATNPLCNDDGSTVGHACGTNPYTSYLSATLNQRGAGDGLWFLIVDSFADVRSLPYTLQVTAP